MLSPCSTCTLRCPILEEPTRSPIMVLSDYAGEQEAKKGRPMVGRTGAELDRVYLTRAGLSRHDVYVSNAYKCRNTKKTPPKHDLVASCAQHWLPWEIRRVQPETIIVAGSTALKLFPGRRLELHHGRPFRGSLYRQFNGQAEAYWSGMVWPTYNPAAGLRSSDYMTPLIRDFWDFGRWYRNPGKWVEDNVPVDPYPNPDYRLLRGGGEVVEYLRDAGTVEASHGRPGMGMDTETEPAIEPGLPDPAHCLSFSLYPGTGAVVMADDLEGLGELYGWMTVFNPLIYIHNGLFDLPVLDRLGMPPLTRMFAGNRRPWMDTMIQAYHQRGPIALKVLAYRELGADMQTFDDLVMPYSVARLVEWLRGVAEYGMEVSTTGKHGKPLKTPRVSSGWDKYRLPRQVGVDKKAVRLLESLTQWTRDNEESQWGEFESMNEAADGDGDDDCDDVVGESGDLKSPWAKVAGWPDNLIGPVVAVYGPPPVKSIAHVPLSLRVAYAARDADMALRLGVGLMERKAVARLINGVNI